MKQAQGERRGFRLFSIVLFLGILTSPGSSPHAQTSGPARDAWQHPELVMDEMGIHAGSAVADVGCGHGYFTFKFANRVRAQGMVYAEDIDAGDLAGIRRRAAEEGLAQIVTVVGAPRDPHLPAAALDAILIMNAYHEFREHEAMLAALYRALKPGGLLALIDGATPGGHPRHYYEGMHRLPEDFERAEALGAGFQFLRQEPGFTRPDDGKQFYFLIFGKPVDTPAAASVRR